MDEKDEELADWAEHQMTLTLNSSTALRGAAAAAYGRSTIERALDDDHHPAEPDRDHLAGQLERARRGIGAPESTPDQGRDER